MADVNIDGVVTWLKGWFYDKSDVDTIANSKANLNQGQANKNVVTNGSGEITVEDKPVIPTDVSNLTDNNNTQFTPKSHSHGNLTNDGKVGLMDNPTNMKGVVGVNNVYQIGRYTSILTSFIKDTSAYSNIGTSANDTQSAINSAIDTAIGNLSSIQAIQVVTTLPTASSSTMGKLYIISENSKVNVYYTEQDGSSYSWHKMDTDILDDLSIDWSDIENAPIIPTDVSELTDDLNKPFTPKAHSHGVIQSNGCITSFSQETLLYVMGAVNPTQQTGQNCLRASNKVSSSVLNDANAHTNIGTSAGTNQTSINTAIDTALGTKGALTDDVDWTYSDNGFTNGVKLVSKTDNANGRITLHLKS